MGTTKTLKRIIEDFVWKGARRDVRQDIHLCPICQAYHDRPIHVAMSDLEIPQTPMQMLGVDIIGPFNETEQGYNYFLTVIDYLLGWAEAYPMKDQIAVE